MTAPSSALSLAPSALEHAAKFYIDGAWVDPASSATLDVINPAVDTSLSHVSTADTSPPAAGAVAEGSSK